MRFFKSLPIALSLRVQYRHDIDTKVVIRVNNIIYLYKKTKYGKLDAI